MKTKNDLPVFECKRIFGRVDEYEDAVCSLACGLYLTVGSDVQLFLCDQCKKNELIKANN